MYPCSQMNHAKVIMPLFTIGSPMRVKDILRLNTYIFLNGVSRKNFCLVTPSRNDNFKSIATLPVANNNAVSTNSFAKLYGGFVIMWSTTSCFGNSRKSFPDSPYPISYKSVLLTMCPRLSKTLLIAPFPQAGSHIVPGNVSTDSNASTANGGVG